MSCPDCRRANAVPTCTTTLYIGTIADADTAVFVYVKNKTTGRVYRHSAASDADGLVSIDLSNPSSAFYMPKMLYEFWIVKQTDGYNTRQDITFAGAEEDTCVLVTFESVFVDLESIYDLLSFSEHTIDIQ